jgi:hypothetical protein
MDQTDTMYLLTRADNVLLHFPSHVSTLRDGISFRIPRLDAAVRSNDYFTTLATTLETIRMDIEDDNPTIAQALDNLVYDLEYLQRRYSIVKKAD